MRKIIYLFCMVFLLMFTGFVYNQPAGTLVVLSKSDNKAELFSVKTWQKTGEIPTGIAPHEAAVSPDGRQVVVTNYGNRQPGNTLSVLDLVTKRVVRTIDLGEYTRPHGIVFLNDNVVLVTAEGKKAVVEVDIQSGKIRRAIPTDQQVSHMIVLSPDKHRAFVANIGSGTVSVLDLKNGRPERIIPGQEGTEGIAWQPGSSLLWFSNRGANTVMIYDAATATVVDTLHTRDFPIRIAMSAVKPLALVSCAKAGVVDVFHYRTRKRVASIPMGVTPAADVETRLFKDRFGKSPVPIGVVAHPHVPLAFVANSNADVVAVVNLETLKVVRYLPTAKQPDGMAWSPLDIQ
ncbi:MAG TPA: gluconolaconase [Calditrichae bacterium]|nr:gluconolaconase [Calditrichia bacterium]